eukprot:COSAG01_NODE_3087_length_6609_cov_2.598925_6_plen_335_part_00
MAGTRQQRSINPPVPPHSDDGAPAASAAARSAACSALAASSASLCLASCLAWCSSHTRQSHWGVVDINTVGSRRCLASTALQHDGRATHLDRRQLPLLLLLRRFLGSLGRRPGLGLGSLRRRLGLRLLARLLLLTRRARNALGTATQCTRGDDSPPPPAPSAAGPQPSALASLAPPGVKQRQPQAGPSGAGAQQLITPGNHSAVGKTQSVTHHRPRGPARGGAAPAPTRPPRPRRAALQPRPMGLPPPPPPPPPARPPPPPPPPGRRRGAYTTRVRCVSILLDKNRRSIGKSQSTLPPKRTQRTPHLAPGRPAIEREASVGRVHQRLRIHRAAA